MFAGVGMIPQLFVNYRQDQKWRTSTGFDDSETIKTSNGYNSFVLTGVVNVGFQLDMGNGTSIVVMHHNDTCTITHVKLKSNIYNSS